MRIMLKLAVLGALTAGPALAGTITGTATYRERIALPPEAVLEATLEDVSRADAPAVVLGRARVEPAGQVPIPFTITYDDRAIDERMSYAVRGRIIVGDELRFTTTESHPVLTRGGGSEVTLRLQRVAGDAAAVPEPGGPLDPLPASFTGTLPCADCPGIDWQVDLLADGSFQLRQTYQHREPANAHDDIGRWAIGSDQRSLILQGGREAPVLLEIRNADTLRLMDRDGRPIESDLPYDLARADVHPLEPRLTMRGMYSYLADAGSFTECLTGRRLPVAMVADNAALEQAYLEARSEPGAPLLVIVEGRIALLPPMEGPNPVPQLEPLEFIRVEPEAACPAPFTQATLEGTDWRLTRLGDEAVLPADWRDAPGLGFDAATGRFAGSGGCNRLMGGYTLDGDRIAFGAVAGTMMFCDGLMETEQAMTAALGAAHGWRVLGRQLELYDAEGDLLARFAAD
jgi:uncharacterized lipoprotein YbaY/uncharacterized lipoprotein NlpE involved in copper resistance/heat shock protein HslJ